MPPPSHAAWDIAVNRQSPAATIAMANRAALGPMMRSTTALSIPPESQIRRPRIATAAGMARMSAARAYPMYHWPRPGHRKESVVAMVGERA